MKTTTLPFLVASALFLLSCGPRAVDGGSYDRNLITNEEIRETTAHTAYEVVQRLQAHWLSPRGNASIGANESGVARDASAPLASVFVNGIGVGDVEYLRGLLASDVAEMRYYGPGEAGARFGMGHPRGVIAVTLR